MTFRLEFGDKHFDQRMRREARLSPEGDSNIDIENLCLTTDVFRYFPESKRASSISWNIHVHIHIHGMLIRVSYIGELFPR